jgi:iron complex outermembrane recepter protein
MANVRQKQQGKGRVFMKSLFRIAYASASVIALSTPAYAQAQTTAPVASAEDEGAIIVTARRKDEDLQDVPAVVNVQTGEDLAKLKVRTFLDVAALVPGLQLTRAGNGITNTVALRGISFNPIVAGPQTAVELYRNDVITTSGAIFQAIYDIKQIEVLRGPQGTLRGRSAPSGSLTITTQRPDLKQAGGFADMTVAERGKYVVTGAVNVPIVAERLGIRVAGFVSQDRGNTNVGNNRYTNTVNRDISDRVHSIRASIRAVPVEDILTLDFNYESTKRKSRQFEQHQSRSFVDGSGINGPVLVSAADRISNQAEPVTLDGTYKFLNWQAQLNFAGQSLTYVGGNLDATTDSQSPDDNGGFLGNVFFVPPAGGPTSNFIVNPSTAGTNLNASFTTSKQQQQFHELRLQNKDRIAGIFDYVVGYMNFKSNTPSLLYSSNLSCTGCVPATNTVGTVTDNVLSGSFRFRTDRESSYYGNLTAHLGENTEISGGVRFINYATVSGLKSSGRCNAQLVTDNVCITAQAQRQVLLFDRESEAIMAARPEAAAFAVNDARKSTVYMLSAKHNFSKDLMVYVSYGTSIRPGNVLVCSQCGGSGTNAATGATLIAGGFLKMPDETSNSIEAGFKSTLLDNRLRLNVSAYQQKFTNLAILSPESIQFLGSYTAPVGVTPATGVLATFTNNFGLGNNVKITGVEGDFAFKASDRFSFGGTFAYAKSEVANGRVPCVDLNNDNIQDSTPITAATLDAFAAQAGPGLVDTCAITRAGRAPNFSATLQAEYNMPVASNLQGYLRGFLTYNGATTGEDPNGVDSVSAYAIGNLFLGIRAEDGAWDLSVYGRNITNTLRVLTRDGSRASSVIARNPYTSDYYRITTTAPREFGINLRVAFGSR